MREIKGVAIGTVLEIDPAAPALIVEFPWMSPPQKSHWAPIAAAMSGASRGAYFMPEVGDEVLVAFEHGQFDHPYVVGFLWNGVDRPPAVEQRMRLFHSVNGHEIAFYDGPPTGGDLGFVRIRDAHGNAIELANGRVSITSLGSLQIRAPNVVINGRVVSPVGPPI